MSSLPCELLFVENKASATREIFLLVSTKLVEWTGYETSQTTKKLTMLLCFMLCAGSQLWSFVLGMIVVRPLAVWHLH